MFKFSSRFFITSFLILSCAQLVTGCLTSESAVRSEAPVASSTSSNSVYLQNSRWNADAWRASWDSVLARSGRDSAVGYGSDYRDLEAGLWIQNESFGSGLSPLRSSSRGGNSFRAPSDSWATGGGRFRSSDAGSFSVSSRAGGRVSQ